MGLQDDVRNLSSNPTLQELEPEALRLIAFAGETRILRAGDVLFRAGDASDGGYVVLSGGIALTSGSHPAAIVRSPALIGEIALIIETLRPCTAVAREASRVLKISRSLFHKVLTEFPLSGAQLHHTLAGRLCALQDELGDLCNALA